MSNQASVEAPGQRGKVLSDDPTTPQPDDPTRLTVQAVHDLKSFSKSVKDLNGGDAEPGDTLEYTLVLQNSGTAYAYKVKVTDPVPPQLENVVPGQGGAAQREHHHLDGGQAGAGDQVSLTFTARIRSPLAERHARLQPGRLADRERPGLREPPLGRPEHCRSSTIRRCSKW